MRVALLLAFACGRIGFDRIDGTDRDAGRDGALADGDVTGDGTAELGCHWIPCGVGDVACCNENVTTCMLAGLCPGLRYDCDELAISGQGACVGTDHCCVIDGVGASCLPGMAACP